MFISAAKQTDDFYKNLHEEFNFKTDVCSTHENAKCLNNFTIEDDGLMKDWEGSCWMNPPYGRTIGVWMKKSI
jgi:DNA N-6-adenine-methyltransferase (Dam).